MILDKIIDRGEKLDIIVDKTDALADTADVWLIMNVVDLIRCSVLMLRNWNVKCLSKNWSCMVLLLLLLLYEFEKLLLLNRLLFLLLFLAILSKDMFVTKKHNSHLIF